MLTCTRSDVVVMEKMPSVTKSNFIGFSIDQSEPITLKKTVRVGGTRITINIQKKLFPETVLSFGCYEDKLDLELCNDGNQCQPS